MADAMVTAGGTHIVLHLSITEAASLHVAADAVLTNDAACKTLYRGLNSVALDAGHRARLALRESLREWEFAQASREVVR